MEREDQDWVIKYFERIISDMDRRIEQAAKASKDAIDKAEAAQDKRLELLNEFRAQAAEEAQKYATREYVDQQTTIVVRTATEREKRISRLERALNIAYGAITMIALIGVANFVRVWTGG